MSPSCRTFGEEFLARVRHRHQAPDRMNVFRSTQNTLPRNSTRLDSSPGEPKGRPLPAFQCFAVRILLPSKHNFRPAKDACATGSALCHCLKRISFGERYTQVQQLVMLAVCSLVKNKTHRHPITNHRRSGRKPVHGTRRGVKLPICVDCAYRSTLTGGMEMVIRANERWFVRTLVGFELPVASPVFSTKKRPPVCLPPIRVWWISKNRWL